VLSRGRWRGLLAVAWSGLRSAPGTAVVDAAAAALGAAALVLFVALGLGVGDAARRLFPADDRLLEVVPGPVSLGGLLGGGLLDDGAVARLAALPGVQAAWPRLTMEVPVAASQAPPGLTGAWPPGMTLQIPVVGLAPGLLAGDLRAGVAFDDPPAGQPVPVALSRRLLELYDKTIAPAWGVPRLPPGFDPTGLELDLRVGLAIVPGRSEAVQQGVRVRLAALSDRVPLYAMAMPLATVRRLHAAYQRPERGYAQVTVQVAAPDDAPAVAAAARRMGFGLDTADRSASERSGAVVAITTAALGGLALLLCVLAALAIARSRAAGVAARARDLALLQALGATGADLGLVVLLEAALVGAAGGLAGIGLGRLGGLLGDGLIQRLLPDFPFRPESFFRGPAWLLGAALGLAVLSAVLGALAPAASAARVEPARWLS
jgi:hypothetical protein